MKRILIIFIAITINLLVCNAQSTFLSNGSLIESLLNTLPNRDIEVINDGVIVKYSFSGINLIPDTIDTTSYIPQIKGFGLNNVGTEPALPIRWDSFYVPGGGGYTITMIDSSYVDYPLEVSPAREPIVCGHGDDFSQTINPIVPYSGLFPLNVLSTSIHKHREQKLLDVCIMPVKYDYHNKTIRFYKNIKYKITWHKTNIRQSPSDLNCLIADDALLYNTVLNKSQLAQKPVQLISSNNTAVDITKDYLVITTPKFQAAAESFADWKRMLGFKTNIVSKFSWTTDAVKDSIQKYYNSTNKKLQYILIIGDVEDVPTNKCQYTNFAQTKSYVSDYPYSILSDGPIMSFCVYTGRISVTTEDEAIQVIDKIISYEKEPTSDATYYSSGLHCSVFEANADNKTERPRAILTNEEIRNSLLPLGLKIERIYTKKTFVTPRKWSLVYALNGDVPDSLYENNFPWKSNEQLLTSMMKAKINKGNFYTLYIGHGYKDRLGSIPFTIDDINTLNNDNKTPVFFSMSCLTGKFEEKQCFSEALLRKKSGGCVAIIAATKEAPFGYTEALTLGMFDAIWPSSVVPEFPNVTHVSEAPTPTYRLGQILQQGYNRMDETFRDERQMNKYTREIFHCFGDPSMRIYTKKPTLFENVIVKRGQDSIIVALQEPSEITFYNSKTNETISFYGKEASLHCKSSDIDVCISNHNKIPYIDYGDMVYIQNEALSYEHQYNAHSVKVGSNVTSLKPQGTVTFLSNSKTSISAVEVTIEGDTSIEKGAELKINSK